MEVLAVSKAPTRKEFVTSKIELLTIILDLYKYFMNEDYRFSLDICELIRDTGYSLEKIKLMLAATDAHLREDKKQ